MYKAQPATFGTAFLMSLGLVVSSNTALAHSVHPPQGATQAEMSAILDEFYQCHESADVSCDTVMPAPVEVNRGEMTDPTWRQEIQSIVQRKVALIFSILSALEDTNDRNFEALVPLSSNLKIPNINLVATMQLRYDALHGKLVALCESSPHFEESEDCLHTVEEMLLDEIDDHADHLRRKIDGPQ